MKLKLLKSLGRTGVFLDWKRFLADRVNVEIGEEGVLTVGPREYKTVNGCVTVPEYLIMQGNSKVLFISADGVTYDCGMISRSGRFINVINNIDSITVSLVLAYEAEGQRLALLEARLEELEKGSTIKIV